MGNEGRGTSENFAADMPSVVALAHELKAPLVLLRQMSFELDETTDPTRARLLRERMRFTSDQSLRLVEQLALSSRFQDTLFESEPIGVQALCNDLASQLSPLARHLEVDVRLLMPQRPLVTVANRDLLPALLRNFCDNALTYTPAGGRMVIQARSQSDRIVLSVRDQGPVVSAQAYRRLLERLGKAPQPIASRPRSSGLGLWIAGQYANAMSAQIYLRRHRMGGMTFSVELPKSEQLSLL